MIFPNNYERNQPPNVGLAPGKNSAKKYAKNGCEESGAALLKNSLRAAKYMLSVYHDSDRSNNESPEWNGPPAVESFAGYKVWISSSVFDENVLLSR